MKGTIKKITSSDRNDWFQSTVFIKNKILVGFGTTPALRSLIASAHLNRYMNTYYVYDDAGNNIACIGAKDINQAYALAEEITGYNRKYLSVEKA